jgi:hypothetical protein
MSGSMFSHEITSMRLCDQHAHELQVELKKLRDSILASQPQPKDTGEENG